MSRLPVCSGADAVKAFRQLGYEVDHQTGSHIILRHPSQRRLTVQTIANWPRELCGR
jgi:predicted RNA binding protein YcfA (HicA-like mRNA interferase family)